MLTLSAASNKNQNENPYGIEEETKKDIKIHKNVEPGNFFQKDRQTSEALRYLGNGLNDVWEAMIDNKEDWKIILLQKVDQFPFGLRTLQMKVAALIMFGLMRKVENRGYHGHFDPYYEAFQKPQPHAKIDLFEEVARRKSGKKSLPSKIRSMPDTGLRPTCEIERHASYNSKQEEVKNNTVKQQHTSNNILVAKPVPKTDDVVVPQNNISQSEKTTASCKHVNPTATTNEKDSACGKIVYLDHSTKPDHLPVKPKVEKIKTVIDRVHPEKRKYVSTRMLQEFENDFDVDVLSDIVIYSINNANRNVKKYTRTCLENKADVDPQNYYNPEQQKEAEDISGCMQLPSIKPKKRDFRAEIEATEKSVKAIADRNRAKQKSSQGFADKPCPKQPLERDAEFILSSGLSDKLRQKAGMQPKIDPKHKRVADYWERKGITWTEEDRKKQREIEKELKR